MIVGPTTITYIAFDTLNVDGTDQWKILLGFIPLGIGLLSLYFWVHVKIFFDQMSRAGHRQVAPPAPPPVASKPVQQNNQPMTIAVMAPYPPYNKNYEVFNGGAGPYVAKPTVRPMPMPMPPPTPMVQPPTPLPSAKILDDY
jgi:hypothetical protein